MSFSFRVNRKFSALRQIVLSLFLAFLAVHFAAFAAFAQEDEQPDNSAEAAALFNKGQDAHEKGDLPAAVKFYEEALKLAPEFPEVEFQRGNALLALGKAVDAEQAFRRAVELREDWTLPMITLGGVLIDRGKFDEAKTFLNKAIKLDANSFPAYAALTEVLLKTKAAPNELKLLLAKLQTLTGKANPTAAIWAARGALEAALNDSEAAKKSLANALTIEPRNASALTRRAEIALAEGDFEQALRDANKLPQNSQNTQILLARVYAESGNAAEATKILDALDAKNPLVASLKNSIAASDATNAAELEKQLEADPKNAPLLGRLCTLLRKENPPKALDYCRRAAEAEPNNINHAVGFGAALVQAKQFDNAIVIFRRILQITPDNFTARANLATALFELKRYAEAKTEYQTLTKKQPKLAIAFYFLAIAHDNLGEYTDAMANYQRLIKIADTNTNKLEIEKVNLRLPALEKQIKNGKGKKK